MFGAGEVGTPLPSNMQGGSHEGVVKSVRSLQDPAKPRGNALHTAHAKLAVGSDRNAPRMDAMGRKPSGEVSWKQFGGVLYSDYEE